MCSVFAGLWRMELAPVWPLVLVRLPQTRFTAVAGFGLAAVSAFLVQQRFWLGLIGGLFLCFLGLKTFLSKPAENPAPGSERRLFSAYLSTFLLTITNPMTILSFVAVFAGMGLASSSNYRLAAALVSGVFIGSALWWILLSSGAALMRKRVGPGLMLVVNRASGTLIFVIGLYSLATLFRHR